MSVKNPLCNYSGQTKELQPGDALPATITKGGIFYNPSGITATDNVIVWCAPFACTVFAVKCYRHGGSGATVNARVNGSLTFLASDLSLTSTDTWIDGGTVQNPALQAGDRVEVMLTGVTGSPTQIAIQLTITRP